jgi:Mg2+ and Co2+ transporter CorA
MSSGRWRGSSDCTTWRLNDAIAAHQGPKLERYGNTLFAVLRPARYLDDVEKVEFGELHVFIGSEFVVTLRHAESPDLAQVRRRLEQTPELLRLGPEAVFYAILDQVVDEYGSLEEALREATAMAARMESGRLHRTSPFGLTYAIVSSIGRREADNLVEPTMFGCLGDAFAQVFTISRRLGCYSRRAHLQRRSSLHASCQCCSVWLDRI